MIHKIWTCCGRSECLFLAPVRRLLHLDMKGKPTRAWTIWMLPGVAILAALIPFEPLLISLLIVLLILVSGVLYPERLFRTALLNTVFLYLGLLAQVAFGHLFFDPFDSFQFAHVVYAFPFVSIAIVFILMIGSFLKSIFMLPKE